METCIRSAWRRKNLTGGETQTFITVLVLREFIVMETNVGMVDTKSGN